MTVVQKTSVYCPKYKPIPTRFKGAFSRYKRPIALAFGIFLLNVIIKAFTFRIPSGGELILISNPNSNSNLRGSEDASSISVVPASQIPNQGNVENIYPGGNPNGEIPPNPIKAAPPMPISEHNQEGQKINVEGPPLVITEPNPQDPNKAFSGGAPQENNLQRSHNAEPPLVLPDSNQLDPDNEDPLLPMPEQNIQGPPPESNQMDPDNEDPLLYMPEQNAQNPNAMVNAPESIQQDPQNAALPLPGNVEQPLAMQEPNPQPPAEEEIEIPRTIDDLRYLTLGSSVTWGAGMEVRYFAYPFLLVKDRTNLSNLAVRAAGPKYPSVCIQSMVDEAAMSAEGSEDYDVIILEYYMRGYDGLYELAQRLRQRYPDAIIILLRLWQPVHIAWYEKNELRGSVQDWAMPKKLFLEGDDFLKAIRNTGLDLRWHDPTPPNAIQNKVVKDFGAHLYEIDKPRDPKEALSKYRDRYSADFNHMNERGHRHLADEIKKIIERELPSYPKQPRRGDWGDGDSCHSWYQSGQVRLQYSLNVAVEQYDIANGKFALSTGLSNPSGHGWVIIDNPFDTPRNLILSYLATGPPPSIYPKTEITVHPENDEANILSQMVLNPVTTDYEHKVHIVLTTKVSVVLPGRSVVKWRPLENTGKPFRLTATAVVGRDVEEGGILGAIKDFTFFG